MSSASPAEPHRRLRWSTVVKAAFLVVALGLGVAFVVQHWSETREALARLGPATVALALVTAAAAQVTAMLSWRATLTDLGHRLTVRDAARVFYLSQLGKYVPGSVWQLAALVELGRRHAVPRKDLAVSAVLSLLVSVMTAAVIGGLLVLLGGAEDAWRWWWTAPIVLVIAIASLHPRIAGPIVDRVLRLARRSPLDRRWTERGMLVVVGWQTLTWLLYGAHCWILVVGLGAPAVDSLLVAVGGFAVAYAAGMLFLPAPAGAGVREAVLGALLVGLVDNGAVVVIVLLSRVMLAAVDVAFGLASLTLGGWRRTPAPATAPTSTTDG